MELLKGNEAYTLLNGKTISHEVSNKIVETKNATLYIVTCWFTEAEKLRLDALKWDVVDIEIVGMKKPVDSTWTLMAIEIEAKVNEIVTMNVVFSLNK